MRDIQSTTRLLKQMSQVTKPRELIRLFFEHVRENLGVKRALVLSSAGLSAPHYKLVHNLSSSDGLIDPVVELDELRVGGLLAEILYAGEFRSITSFVPDSSDPAFGLLQGSSSLTAFPLFEKGAIAGMVVVLSSCPPPHNAADLCDLATMTSLLGRAIEAQKLAIQLGAACRALDSELRAAADVQRWLLPALPSMGGIELAASYRTARYSSGDYYDVGCLPDGRVGVLIADVSGKGAAAAVVMAILRAIVHDELDRTGTIGPAALLDYVDGRLRAMGLSERSAFVTAFCGIWDPATGEFVYACAGHNPPRLLRARDRTVTSLDGAATFPLGLLDEAQTHMEETIMLAPGDLALFYTDGITEARSRGGEFFGVERLDELLRGLPHPITAEAAVEGVAKAVASFEGNAMPADDQTLLALGGCAAVRHSGESPFDL